MEHKPQYRSVKEINLLRQAWEAGEAVRCGGSSRCSNCRGAGEAGE